MAILDDKLYFSKEQAITAKTDTVSDYYLDVKKIKEIGKGSPLYVNIDVCSAFYSAANKTMDIYLCTHTGAPTSAHRVAAIALNKLVAGAVSGNQVTLSTVGKKIKVPLPALGLKSHIGLVYQLSSTMSSGNINAYLSLG